MNGEGEPQSAQRPQGAQRKGRERSGNVLVCSSRSFSCLPLCALCPLCSLWIPMPIELKTINREGAKTRRKCKKRFTAETRRTRRTRRSANMGFALRPYLWLCVLCVSAVNLFFAPVAGGRLFRSL